MLTLVRKYGVKTQHATFILARSIERHKSLTEVIERYALPKVKRERERERAICEFIIQGENTYQRLMLEVRAIGWQHSGGGGHKINELNY